MCYRMLQAQVNTLCTMTTLEELTRLSGGDRGEISSSNVLLILETPTCSAFRCFAFIPSVMMVNVGTNPKVAQCKACARILDRKIRSEMVNMIA